MTSEWEVFDAEKPGVAGDWFYPVVIAFDNDRDGVDYVFDSARWDGHRWQTPRNPDYIIRKPFLTSHEAEEFSLNHMADWML